MYDFARKTLFVIGVLLLCLLIYVVRTVFIYVVIAVLLAYFMYGPVRWLRNRRVPRGLAILLVFLGIVVVIGGLVALITPVMYNEAADFAKDVPALLADIEAKLNAAMERAFPGGGQQFAFNDAVMQAVENLRQNLPQTLQSSFAFVSKTLNSSITFLLGLILIPLMCYYFLVDAEKFKNSFKKLFPHTYNERIETTFSMMNVMLGNYVRAQITLSFIMALLVTVGLSAFGVKYALLLGLLAGFAELIPMIGPVIGFFPAALIALSASPVKLLLVVILYAGLHLLENNVLVPRIMGKNMDLHPLTVIIAMMIGAQVMGLLGILIALPATAAAKIALNILVFRREELGLGKRDKHQDRAKESGAPPG
jgi:predicted PurR-regulated permease PerM